MKACSYCGIHNSSDATHCSECGIELPLSGSEHSQQPQLPDALGQMLERVVRGRPVDFHVLMRKSPKTTFDSIQANNPIKRESVRLKSEAVGEPDDQDKVATGSARQIQQTVVATSNVAVSPVDSVTKDPSRDDKTEARTSFRKQRLKIGALLILLCLIGWRYWDIKVKAKRDAITREISYKAEHRANLLRGVSLSAWPYGQKQGRTLAMLVTTERFSLSSERSKLELANLAESQWYEYRGSEKAHGDISLIKAIAECTETEVEQAWVDGFIGGVKAELQPVLDRN